MKKLKTAVKIKTGTTLRLSLKMFDGNDLPHELFLPTRQKRKLRNAFNNNMSFDIKLSQAQISKIVRSGELLGSLLSISGPLMKVAVPLEITAAASVIDAGRNKWFTDNNFTNLKWRNERHIENHSS